MVNGVFVHWTRRAVRLILETSGLLPDLVDGDPHCLRTITRSPLRLEKPAQLAERSTFSWRFACATPWCPTISPWACEGCGHRLLGNTRNGAPQSLPLSLLRAIAGTCCWALRLLPFGCSETGREAAPATGLRRPVAAVPQNPPGPH